MLATSREPLRIDGERIWLVPPFRSLSLTMLWRQTGRSRTEAVRLLAERAEAALPSFVLSPSNCQSAVEICRRLDGIPLAIELAAARVRVLSLEQIAARLHDGFRVLGAGYRTEALRHQTLAHLFLEKSARPHLRFRSGVVGNGKPGDLEDGQPIRYRQPGTRGIHAQEGVVEIRVVCSTAEPDVIPSGDERHGARVAHPKTDARVSVASAQQPARVLGFGPPVADDRHRRCDHEIPLPSTSDGAGLANPRGDGQASLHG